MSMEDLIWHYFKSNVLLYKAKKTIRSKIRHQLKMKYKLPSLDHIIIKLPTNNYNRKTIKMVVRKAIFAHTAIPAYLQQYLIKNTRVVLTKRKSILDIIGNNIKMTKAFTTKKPKCSCTRINMNIPGCTQLHGHCMQKYSDLPIRWRRMNTNLKNIPTPNNIDTKMELEKGLEEYIHSTLYKFHPYKTSKAKLKRCIPTGTPCAANTPTPEKTKIKIAPIMWDLFSGTSSVGKIFKAHGWVVRSFEKDKKLAKKYGATCTCVKKYDFLKLAAKEKPDFIWGSPVCTPWSNATPKKIRQSKAMKDIGLLSKWTFDLVHKVKPKFWCIENPAETLLHQQKYTKNVPRTECSQCMYGQPFRKNTTIFNNFNLKLKTCNHTERHRVKLGDDYGGTPGCRK